MTQRRTQVVAGVIAVFIAGGRSTTSTGWWKDVSPEKAAPAATDFKKQLVIMSDATTGELSVRVSLADEKRELEYVQRFRRDRP